jgi:hypothetical protein
MPQLRSKSWEGASSDSGSAFRRIFAAGDGPSPVKPASISRD